MFLAQGLTAFGQVGWSMLGLRTVMFIATSMAWVIGAPVAFCLLAVVFARGSAVGRDDH
jgi:hypothetical protein